MRSSVQMHVKMCRHTHSYLLVQISPPAVHFSLALWSLFMSPSVPPPDPLFLLHSPSVTFHAFLLPFLISAHSSSLLLHSVCYQIFHHCEQSEMTSFFLFVSLYISPPKFFLHHKDLYFTSTACNLNITLNLLFIGILLCFFFSSVLSIH